MYDSHARTYERPQRASSHDSNLSAYLFLTQSNVWSREEVGTAPHVLEAQRAALGRIAEGDGWVALLEVLVQLLKQRLAVHLHKLREGL